MPPAAGTVYFDPIAGTIASLTGRVGGPLSTAIASVWHSNYSGIYGTPIGDDVQVAVNTGNIFWAPPGAAINAVLGTYPPTVTPASPGVLSHPAGGAPFSPGSGGYPSIGHFWAPGLLPQGVMRSFAGVASVGYITSNADSPPGGTLGAYAGALIEVTAPTLMPADANDNYLATLPDGVFGVAYELSLPLNGNRKIHGKSDWDGLSENFNMSATGLPPGVTLATDGQFVGSPSAYGEYAVTIRIDSTNPFGPFHGFYTEYVYSLTVPCPAIAVTPSDELPASVSRIVEYVAAGGTGPYTYAIVGAKPVTWTLAGEYLTAPVPIPAGTYDFDVVATDVYGCTGSVSYAFTAPESDMPSGDTIGLSWVELTDKASTVHTWARIALPDPATYYDGYKEPRVESFGTVRRSLSDDYGQPEAIDFSFTVSDNDRLIRGLLANHTTRSLAGRSVVARMITDELRRVQATPRTYFRGFVSDYKLEAPLQVAFTAQDPLAVRFSRSSEAEQLPKRLITAADFPTAPTEPIVAFPNVPVLIGAPVPIIYGDISDTQIAAVTVATINQLVQDATIAAPVLDSLQRVAGTITDPIAVHVGITAIKAGKEGPFSNVLTLPARGGVPSTFGVRVNFSAVAGVDSYRVYFTDDRNVVPYVTNAAATRLLYMVHDNATVDGANPPSYQVTLTDPAGAGVVDLIGGSAPAFADAGVGQCPLLYVGDVPLPDGQQWRRFLIAGHACKEITEVYADNRPLGIRKAGYWPATLTTPASFGAPLWVDLVVPGTQSWDAMFGAGTPSYEDINGRRYTFLYVKVHDIGGDRAAGFQPSGFPDVVPGAVSVKGIEDIGDGTGALITDLLMQYRHCLQNWILGDYQAGAWLPSPMHTDDATVSIINDASFDAASVIAHLRVPGGYRGDFIIGATAIGANAAKIGGERISVRDLVARFNVCADVNSGWNRHTQFFVSMFNDQVGPGDGLPRLTDASDIYKDSLTIVDDLSKLWNVVPFRHTIDYFNREPTGWRSVPGGVVELTDDLSILEYASADMPAGVRRVAPVLELHLLRGINGPKDYAGYAQGAATAADVVRRWLIRHKDPPRTIGIKVAPVAMNFDIGDIVRVTHYGGVGPAGYQDQPCRIMRHDTDPNSLTITLELLDVKVLYEGGVILGDDTVLPALWTDADAAERYYAYLADEGTGKFSDGANGKRFR